MLRPICFENDVFFIHPFRSEDLKRYEKLVHEIYDLMSDENTLHFIPEKRLSSVADAEAWLKATILNFHCGRNFIHFITDKESGKLLGIIDIISPQLARANYRLEEYPYFIEFYLSGNARGKKIMSHLLPVVIAELHKRDISHLGAVVNRSNAAALKVLSSTGFQYRSAFDPVQDLYRLSIHNIQSVRKAG